MTMSKQSALAQLAACEAAILDSSSSAGVEERVRTAPLAQVLAEVVAREEEDRLIAELTKLPPVALVVMGHAALPRRADRDTFDYMRQGATHAGLVRLVAAKVQR
jgi:hypothetical protein